MRWREYIAAALVAGVSRSAFAQETAPPLIAGDRGANEQLMKILDAARVQGLPVDPILAKVSYAVMVTHSSPQRIVAAAQAVAARLPIARDALAPRDTPRDIVAAEIAMSYDVPKEVVREIRNASHDPSVAVPLGALTQLVTGKVSVKRAAEIVLSLMRRGVSAERLAAFSNDVNSDVLQGGRPDDALTVRMRLLSAVLAPGAAGTSVGLSTVPGTQKPKP